MLPNNLKKKKKKKNRQYILITLSEKMYRLHDIMTFRYNAGLFALIERPIKLDFRLYLVLSGWHLWGRFRGAA